MKLLMNAADRKFTKGRRIDPDVAELEGEGAEQSIRQPEPHPKREGYGVWSGTPSSSFVGVPTYYRLPMIKEPVWRWMIPAYFYVGGAAGASAALAGAAQLIAPSKLRRLILKCRLVAMGGIAASTVLLIADLGIRPRFINMLRVFRPTSPMNIGTWILTSSGMLTAASLMGRNGSAAMNAISNAAGIGSGVVGVALAGYTGVLLNASAVPIWQEAGRSLPLLFLASGISGASAALQMMDLSRRDDSVVHAYSVAGLTAELAAAQALEFEVRNFPHVRKTLHQGVPGRLWKAGKLLALLGLVLTIVPGRSKRKRIVAAALEGAGAMSMRFAIYKAGQVSARDPESTIDLHQHRPQKIGSR